MSSLMFILWVEMETRNTNIPYRVSLFIYEVVCHNSLWLFSANINWSCTSNCVLMLFSVFILFYIIMNFKEARALLGRLEYQRGNFEAALHVLQGIDISTLTPRMIRAIAERNKLRKPRSKAGAVLPNLMSMHSVSLLLEAILLKAKSLEELKQYTGITHLHIIIILFQCFP